MLAESWQTRRMAHMVIKKGRYAELHENVPGKRGKKRFVRYLGILGRIDWSRMNGDGVDWYAIEQAELTRIKQDELAHEMYRDLQNLVFKEETGLDLPVGPVDPVPIEITPSASHAAPASPSEPGAGSNDSATPSSPDATPGT
jgi:hypothetical protein